MSKIIGVSLGENYLQAVLIDRQGEIRQKFALNFKEAIFRAGKFTGLAVLKKELARLPAEMKKVKQLTIALPSSLFYSQFLVLKAVGKDKINQYLDTNADKLFPFSTEEICYDWKLISQSESVSEIAVVAINKEIIEQIISAFESNQLRPLVLIPSSLALLDLFLFISQRRRPKIIVKEEEKSKATESKERKGLVLLEKGSGELILTAIIDHSPIFSLSFPYQEGSPQIKDQLNRNLERLIAFCEQKYQSSSPLAKDHYLKIGQVLGLNKSLLKEISDDWKKRLSVVAIEPAQIISNLNADKESLFAALGAALHQPLLPQEVSTINLLSGELQDFYLLEEKFKKEVFYLKRTLLGLLFLLMIILSAGLLVRWQVIKTNKEFIDFKNGSQIDAAFLDLEKRANTLNNNIKKINHLMAVETFPLDIVKQIEKSLVEGITVSEFKYKQEEKELQITGTAAARDNLLQFTNNLESAGFGEVSIPLGSLEQEANFSFNLSLQMP